MNSLVEGTQVRHLFHNAHYESRAEVSYPSLDGNFQRQLSKLTTSQVKCHSHIGTRDLSPEWPLGNKAIEFPCTELSNLETASSEF